ncbi:MAG: hypothetical protein GY711_01335 [bacterium]|nr:hypothetical protein [bacterium]
MKAFLLLPLAACAVPTPSLRIVSYNIHHGRGADGEIDLRRTATVLAALEPDVVLLQEVDQATGRSGGVDQARELGALLGMHSTFGPHRPYDGGAYGLAVLTRSPPIATNRIDLPPGPAAIAALAVRIEAGALELIACSAHLFRSDEQKQAQARALIAALERLAPRGTPVVVGADLNAERGSAVLACFASGWSHAEEARPTFPSAAPTLEIDFVLWSPPDAFVARRSLVADGPAASDHRALLVELTPLRASRPSPPRAAPAVPR